MTTHLYGYVGKNIFFTHKLWHKFGGAYNVTPICYAAILMNILDKGKGGGGSCIAPVLRYSQAL